MFKASKAARPWPLGGAFPNAQPAVQRAYRLLPGTGVVSQVVQGHTTVRCLDYGGNGFGNRTLIKGAFTTSAIIRSERANPGLQKISPGRGPSHLWSALLRQGISQLPAHAVFPGVGGQGGNRKALLCKPDRGGEDGAERQATKTLDQVTPASTGSGHSDGMGMIWRQLRTKTFRTQALQGQRGRRAPGAVQSTHLTSLGVK